MKMGKLTALGLLASACSPAAATGFTTITQSFSSYYGTQGGGEVDEIFQYGGPLRLYKVTVTWSGFAAAGFEDPTGEVEGIPYTQGYSAGVYYDIYGPDSAGGWFEFGGGKTFVGAATCTTASCELSFGANGVDVTTDTSGFVGHGTLTVDGNLSYIDPNFCCEDFSHAFVGVGGTVTYLLGPVPEPASWAMMVSGFGLVGGAMRSRRKTVFTFG